VRAYRISKVSVSMNRMVRPLRFVVLVAVVIVLVLGATQAAAEAGEESGGGYRDEQIPGLNKSASKIFFSKEPWSVSGWGELNGVWPVQGERDRSSGDIELYYETLTRLTGYLGLRPAENIALTLEAQIEHLTAKTGDPKTEFIPEFYFDFLGNEHFNSRFGLSPMHIGYINNNDEPVLFYSVNRPESERLIIPSEWIELGLHFYGGLTKDLHYSLAFTNGVEAKDFRDATWIRGGKEGRLDLHGKEQICVNPQIEYTGFRDLTLSLSGYHGRSGQGEKVVVDSVQQEVKAPVTMVSGYGRWDRGKLRLIVMGAYGWLGETDLVYVLTGEKAGDPQVLGSQAYGAYIEAGYEVFRRAKSPAHSGEEARGHGGIFGPTVKSLSFFGRVEKLDTHGEVIAELESKSYVRNNLTILLVGLNYKHWQHLVLKLDYQFRHNQAAPEGTDSDSGLIELGLGLAL